MTAPDWPESVPVLTAKDIHRGGYDGPNGTHCLLGHARSRFGRFQWYGGAVEAALIDAVHDAGGLSVASFNDDPTNAKTAIANVWNKAMRSLGYTEIHEVDA